VPPNHSKSEKQVKRRSSVLADGGKGEKTASSLFSLEEGEKCRVLVASVTGRW